MKRILNYLFHRDHLIVVLSGFLLFGLLRLITLNINFLNPIANALDDFSVSDIFFEIQQDESTAKTNDLVTLVDMTELTDRGDIAYLLEEINACEPLVIGIDLIFEGKKDDSTANEMLKESVKDLGDKTVYSTKLIDYNSNRQAFGRSVQSFFADEIHIAEGYTNLNDNMERRCIRNFSIKQKLNDDTQFSFPAKIAAFFNNSIGQLDGQDLLINFKNEKFPVVKYDEIQEKKELIESHIVLIGALTEEQDMHNSPIGKMSGLELQAYSLLTLLEQKNIKKIPTWIEWLLVLLVCYLLEIAIDIVWQWVKKKDKSAFMVFLKESNLVSVVMLFIGLLFVCWLTYILFIKRSLLISGGLIMGMMALTCEGRDILIAIIKGLKAKNKDNKFVKTALLKDID